jgi:hypothetical protein
MNGHRPFGTATLRRDSPQSAGRVRRQRPPMLCETTLEGLRELRLRSPKEVTAEMATGRPAVAELEQQTDMPTNAHGTRWFRLGIGVRTPTPRRSPNFRYLVYIDGVKSAAAESTAPGKTPRS